MQTALL